MCIRKRALIILAFFAAIVLFPSCTPTPGGVDLSLARDTDKRLFRVSVRPLAGPIALNEIHAWTIHVTAPDGRAVPHLRFTVKGSMPQHGHGLPTQPRVKEVGEGMYLLEGMKFNLPGRWKIQLGIDSANGTDEVSFNIIAP